MQKWTRKSWTASANYDPTEVIKWERRVGRWLKITLIGGGYGIVARVFIFNWTFFISEMAHKVWYPIVNRLYSRLEDQFQEEWNDHMREADHER